MASIDRPPAKGNLGRFALRPEDTPERPAPIPAPRPEKPWVIRTPQPFLSFQASPYSPRVRLMMLILDGHCRGLCYMWFGNAALAEEFGCELRNLKEILREMEALGLIFRVIVGRGRKARVGIVMRKRADPDLPAAETDEELADAIARLKARREGPEKPARTGRKNARAEGRKNAPGKGQENAPELRSSSREDASSDDAGEEEALAPRRRPEETTTGATPSADADGRTAAAAAPVPARPSPVPAAAPAARATRPPAPAPIAGHMAAIAARVAPGVAAPACPSPVPAPIPPAAVPPPAPAPAAVAAAEPGPPALSAGQVEALAAMTPAEQARFDAMSPGKRAQVLAPHAAGFDPAMLQLFRADLNSGPAPELPPPDAGPAELIAALAGPMGRSLLARASDALIAALGDRGGAKSFGANLKLCGEVMKRTRRPESLIEPLARTLAELARGKVIDNPAAYWRESVTNWDRDHPGPDAG